MKYLFINGSPHRGNTWKLAELVKNYIKELYKNVTIEEIHMHEQKIPFCCGCSNCFRIGHQYCPHFQYLEPIIKAMEEADGIVVVSPAYNLRETTLLKNLFDHLCFYLHRPHFFTSKALILTTTGGVGERSAAKSIASMLKGIGFNSCYLFPVKSYSWNDYQPSNNTIKRLHHTINKFTRDVESRKLHPPGLGVLIPYNLFRGMSLAYVKGTEFETEDGVYWIQEDRQKYVYDRRVKVPFYLKIYGQCFYAIGRWLGKKITVTYKK